MTQETKKKIHLLYGIVLSAVTVLAGICLIAACLSIYRGGVASGAAQIYTRDIVAAHFAKISIPVYACLVLVIGGMVLNLALPLEKPKPVPEKNLPLILRKLQEKADLEACGEDLRKAVAKERKLRKAMALTCAIVLACGFLVFICYACSADNWGSNSTPSMVRAMYVMLPSLGVPFICAVTAAYRSRKSLQKEIELMRKAAAQAPKTAETAPAKAVSGRTVNIIRIAILVAGAALVILGACSEGTRDILTKAVNICTECVGLG